ADGFRGGRATYGVRVGADGIALKARHWKHGERADAAHHDPKHELEELRHKASSPRAEEKPLESAELVLRTTHVGRSGDKSVALDDAALLEDNSRELSWERENHTEHLRQTPDGVEQSWEFAAAPEGRGDLTVRVDVSGLKYVGKTAE